MVDTCSLLEARHKWRTETLLNGGICPCCDRWGKIYTRKFNSTMARSLCWLVAEWLRAEDWVDVPKMAPRFVVASNQLPTVQWWGLIERRPNEDPARKHSGQWRPTRKGVAVARRERKIPQSVVTYNGDVLDFSDDEMYISDCFRQHFHYQEMMDEDWAGPIRPKQGVLL